jgi:predicted nucleic acid-binding protein
VIVLDASVLIAVMTPADAHHRAARELLARAVVDAEALLVNPVTLAEALVLPTRENRVGLAMAELTELGVSEWPFPPNAARTLARLRVTGVKMPDCCVLLTALDQDAAVASFDERLRRAAREQGIATR